MAKKLNKTFAKHDFEVAREGCGMVGRDLHADLKKTIDAVDSGKLQISEKAMLDHSPWLEHLRETAKKNWIPKDDAHLKTMLTEGARDFMR